MNKNFPKDGAIPLPNPSYPMANMHGSAYSAPLNFNNPSEVVSGYDAKINPMTGEEVPQTNFAGGGSVRGLASLVASKGQAPDNTLVHMSQDEVRALQDI